MNDPYPRTQTNIIGNFTHVSEWMTEAVCAQRPALDDGALLEVAP